MVERNKIAAILGQIATVLGLAVGCLRIFSPYGEGMVFPAVRGFLSLGVTLALIASFSFLRGSEKARWAARWSMPSLMAILFLKVFFGYVMVRDQVCGGSVLPAVQVSISILCVYVNIGILVLAQALPRWARICAGVSVFLETMWPMMVQVSSTLGRRMGMGAGAQGVILDGIDAVFLLVETGCTLGVFTALSGNRLDGADEVFPKMPPPAENGDGQGLSRDFSSRDGDGFPKGAGQSLGEWFSVQGRVSRRCFWAKLPILLLLLMGVNQGVGHCCPSSGLEIVYFKASFGATVQWCADCLIMSLLIPVSVRRFHDCGFSGVWVVLLWGMGAFFSHFLVLPESLLPGDVEGVGSLFPILYLVKLAMGMFAALVLLVVAGGWKGTEGPNRYGESPFQEGWSRGDGQLKNES